MSKNHENRNRDHHKDPYAVMTAEQRFELIEATKDGVFKIISRNKYRWGYENWVEITASMAIGDYHRVHNIISSFNDSKSKRYALELIEEVLRIKKSINSYERGVK